MSESSDLVDDATLICDKCATPEALAIAKKLADDTVSYRDKRFKFVLFVTILSMLLAFLLAYFKTGTVVEHAVDSFLFTVQTLLVTYFGASVVDRSGVLNSVGARLRNGPSSDQSKPT